MTKYLIRVFFLHILVIGGTACNPKETIMTRWPDGQKQVTYKINSGDTAHLEDTFYCAYYPNGKVWKSGYLKKCVEDGDWHFYYQSGQMKSKGHFTIGKMDGSYQTFYNSGEVEQTGTYKNGQLLEGTSFNRDGSRKAEEDLTRYLVEHPEKWTDAQKDEIWIDCFAAISPTDLHAKEFSDCVVELLQRRCNFQDIKALTSQQRGDLLTSLATQQDCFSLLQKRQPIVWGDQFHILNT